jgi:hypothetical protein
VVANKARLPPVTESITRAAPLWLTNCKEREINVFGLWFEAVFMTEETALAQSFIQASLAHTDLGSQLSAIRNIKK